MVCKKCGEQKKEMKLIEAKKYLENCTIELDRLSQFWFIKSSQYLWKSKEEVRTNRRNHNALTVYYSRKSQISLAFAEDYNRRWLKEWKANANI